MIRRYVALVAITAIVIATPAGRYANAGEVSPETRSTSAPAPITLQMATAVTHEIVSEIEALRGLSFKKTVPVKVIDDDEARTYMLTRLSRFEMQQQMELTGEAYALLGLLPEKVDMVEAVLEVMREQAGGFYDPTAEVFYLLSDMPAVMLPMITAHELTHALEDQHFGLDSRLEENIDDDDRLFAVSAVHEGSAMVVMSLFSARRLVSGVLDPAELGQQVKAQQAQQEALLGLPPVLLRQMLGPYILGAGFLARGNLMQTMAGGFPTKDVDRAFRSGPLSSEQILHPEKYWDPAARDDPKEVRIRGVKTILGRRWTRAASGVLGELSLGVLVGAETPATNPATMMRAAAGWTNLAATGWGGDRWELWKRRGGAVAIAVIDWDTATDVEEFLEALPERSGVALAHEGKRVVMIGGNAGKKQAALLAALLETGRADVVPESGNR